MLLHEILPGSSVEELVIVTPHWVGKMDFEVALSLIDLSRCDDGSRHVPPKKILKTEEANVFVRAAPTFKIGVNGTGRRWVLQVMRNFVRVRHYDDVVEAR